MKINTLNQIYRDSLSLLTDFYQITMGHGYWKNNMHDREAVFHLYYRTNPFKGDYAIACGLSSVIDYLQQAFQFSPEDIHYLGRMKDKKGQALFEESFLNYLQRLEFSCDVDAIPEGTIVFPNEPLIRIKGPLFQAQLLETALLNLLNFPTLVATKASRVATAAAGDMVMEFGLRRAQGVDGGLTASRAAYIGGCHATSNVLAGRLFNIPVKGTHAHSWIMSFDSELEAFHAYAEAMPDNTVLLVDSYDTIEGIKNAILTGKILESKGHKLNGIRLDSGDLLALSIKARKMLDDAGFVDAKIVASNDLDEYRIKELKAQGAAIDIWGVGTHLATAYDQPALNGVYKLAAIKNTWGGWEYKMKLSENKAKVSPPGILQVKRLFKNNLPVVDTILNITSNKTALSADETILLQPIFREGKLVYQTPDIHDIRKKTIREIELFQQIDLKNYKIIFNKELLSLQSELIDNIKAKII